MLYFYEPHPRILRMRNSIKIMATRLVEWSRSLHFVKLLLILVASCCCVCRARPPNFVVFFADE